MPRTRMGPAAVKPTAIPVKSPPVMSGIGRRWVNASGSKKQYRRGTAEGPSDGLPGTVISNLTHQRSLRNRPAGLEAAARSLWMFAPD